MRWLKGAAVVFVALAMHACDEFPLARITNNSGQAVVVVGWAAGEGARRLTLQPGAVSERLMAYGNGKRFTVLAGGCAYQYVYPPMGVNYAFRTPDGSDVDYTSSYPVGVQLEPDFQVYLRPPKAQGVLPRRQLETAQGHGFPLKPVSKTCS